MLPTPPPPTSCTFPHLSPNAFRREINHSIPTRNNLKSVGLSLDSFRSPNAHNLLQLLILSYTIRSQSSKKLEEMLFSWFAVFIMLPFRYRCWPRMWQMVSHKLICFQNSPESWGFAWAKNMQMNFWHQHLSRLRNFLSVLTRLCCDCC